MRHLEDILRGLGEKGAHHSGVEVAAHVPGGTVKAGPLAVGVGGEAEGTRRLIPPRRQRPDTGPPGRRVPAARHAHAQPTPHLGASLTNLFQHRHVLWLPAATFASGIHRHYNYNWHVSPNLSHHLSCHRT